MHYLHMLDLSNNPIIRIDTNEQAQLEKLKLISKNLTVNMFENPFQCSCDNIQFLRWMLRNEVLFWNFRQYSCQHNNVTVTFNSMYSVLNKLDYHCSLEVIVKTTAVLLAFLIVVVAISVFLYRHRWDVRVLLHQVHRQKKCIPGAVGL